MGRRHNLDKYPEAKKEAIKMYQEGKTIREIEKEIKVKFPNAQTSKSAIHRIIKKIKPFLQLRDAGVISDNDINLIAQAENLSALSYGLLMEVIAEWQEKGTIEEAKLDKLMDLLATAGRLGRDAAYIEKTKNQLLQFTEKLFEKVTAVIVKNIPDEETRERILRELRDELQA
jgi:hypothetical protein